jgi:hypothetical protein
LAGEASGELSAVLKSADADASEAAIARVRARMQATLGPAFEPDAPQPSAASSGAAWLSKSGPWLTLAALLAIGAWFGSRARPPQPTAAERPAAVMRAVESSSPPPSAAVAAPEVEMPRPTAAKPLARIIKHNVAHPAPVELGLAEELRQLAQIRRQLAASPQRALTAIDAQDQRFPHGTLGAERELLRIDALLRMGRVADARERAERALRTPGGHPYRAQIEKLLAGT